MPYRILGRQNALRRNALALNLLIVEIALDLIVCKPCYILKRNLSTITCKATG